MAGPIWRSLSRRSRCDCALALGALGCSTLVFGLSSAAFAAEQAQPEIVASYPHDAEAFTQGLLLYCGEFYESTGLYGESTLRRVEPHSGRVLHSVDLPAQEFGEGLARVEERLIQLTWQEGVAHQWELQDFTALGDFAYAGEGWGLCYDGERLVMSDGSSELFFRDPVTFEISASVTVTLDGAPVSNLNELECVGDLVYANVWMTDLILRIDPSTGEVLTEIDASGLLTAAEASRADVLNGIAYDPESGHFFIGGKLWPKIFEVRFPFSPGTPDPLPQGMALFGAPEPAVFAGCAESPEMPAADAGRAPPETPLNAPPAEPGRPSGCQCQVPSQQHRSTDGGWLALVVIAGGYLMRSQRTTSFFTSSHR